MLKGVSHAHKCLVGLCVEYPRFKDYKTSQRVDSSYHITFASREGTPNCLNVCCTCPQIPPMPPPPVKSFSVCTKCVAWWSCCNRAAKMQGT